MSRVVCRSLVKRQVVGVFERPGQKEHNFTGKSAGAQNFYLLKLAVALQNSEEAEGSVPVAPWRLVVRPSWPSGQI
jgi:hypothetical protein